jgi:protein-disulfide isomerase
MKILTTILPILLLSGTATAIASDSSNTAVAAVNGKTITEEQLNTAIGHQLERLRAEEYRIKQGALDQLIAKELLDNEAKARGMTTAELLDREVERVVPPVDDAVVEQAWASAKGTIRELPKEKAKEQLASMMRAVALRERRVAFVAGLSKRSNVKRFLDPPRLQISQTSKHTIGDTAAPVTMVVFSDFECPFCGRAQTTLRDVQLRYGQKLVRIAYRHLPLPMHAHAEKAAEAAECAGEQGAFWEFGERMFANQKALDTEDLTSYATSLKLDANRFKQCLDSGRGATAVAADRSVANSFGLRSTPSIFINGRWVVDTSFENMMKTIDEELDRAGVAVPSTALGVASSASQP